jgi:hypothetical protein
VDKKIESLTNGSQASRLRSFNPSLKNLSNLRNLWTKKFDPQITQIKKIILNLKSKSLIPYSEFIQGGLWEFLDVLNYCPLLQNESENCIVLQFYNLFDEPKIS